MDKFLYYLVTVLESALSVVGIRATYEQPRYAVVERLGRGVEIRAYDGRMAVETDSHGRQDGEAFGRLFRYITGANRGGDRISMTAPVETDRRLIAMTVPVEQGAAGTMRFYLPRKVAEAGAPEPIEPGVRLVRVPPEQMAVLRFSGNATSEVRDEQARILSEVLDKADRKSEEAPFFMGYDPPFSVPFLRRNEVAVRLPPSGA
ncbi:SOUL family heme-binding protein [Methylobacterium oxalidis]|uniref:SOUL family heme-binding protein n=1 Tax=Methylobacterium oxalidis TaxID=944322 RepID=UPI0033150C43